MLSRILTEFIQNVSWDLFDNDGYNEDKNVTWGRKEKIFPPLRIVSRERPALVREFVDLHYKILIKLFEDGRGGMGSGR